jgi:hypothetical protein
VADKAHQLGLSHLIRKPKQTRYGIDIKLHDAQKALELFGRHHKLFAVRTDHSGGVVMDGVWTVELDPGPPGYLPSGG